MDEIRNEIPNGVIVKSGSVGAIEVSPEDLRKINKFALSPLSAEDVFVFKAEVGDNELDDRNYEPFNLQALKDMQKLYIGKTVIRIIEKPPTIRSRESSIVNSYPKRSRRPAANRMLD